MASVKLNAGVASVSPKARVTPPTVIVVFCNLALVILLSLMVALTPVNWDPSPLNDSASIFPFTMKVLLLGPVLGKVRYTFPTLLVIFKWLPSWYILALEINAPKEEPNCKGLLSPKEILLTPEIFQK